MLIHIGSFIHWFMGSFIHWFTKALIHWMIHSFFHSLVHWFAHWHVDSLSPSFIDPIIHWLAHSLVHWLINSLTQPSVHWFFHVIDSLSFCRHLNNHFLMGWCALWPQLFIASASQRVPIGHWFLIAIAIFGNICPGTTGHRALSGIIPPASSCSDFCNDAIRTVWADYSTNCSTVRLCSVLWTCHWK